MNFAALFVAVITLLALMAHVFVGSRETASLAPGDAADGRTPHWVQAMCAFQMLSVDLLALTVGLFWLAFFDPPMAGAIQFAIGLLFVAWGTVWLVQMRTVSQRVSYRKLPQWAVWFVCAAVLLWPWSG